MKIVWDEPKRLANLDKHGLDFADLNEAFSTTRWSFLRTTRASAGLRSASAFRVSSLSSSPGSGAKASASSACDPQAVAKGNSMPNARKKSGYTKRDLRAVSDNPELTKADFAKARPFAEVFPDLSASIRKGRGPNKAPTKKLVSLRLSPEVVEHFKSTGPGWQSRIDETLRKAVKRKAS
jgi:uncharacterized protein (DUF4415 family)